MENILTISRLFGLAGEPVALVGGQGRAYLVGGVVLKPAESTAESNWVADFFDKKTTPTGIRLQKPVRSINGNWIESGFVGWTFLEGAETSGRYEEKLRASEIYHAAMADVSEPDFIQRRENPYAVADKIAWQEKQMNYDKDFAEVVQSFLDSLEPLDLPRQLIHGDLAGNILFHPALPPAIIDQTPYWRPVDFAKAILLVDALAWDTKTKESEIFEAFQKVDNIRQLSIRAVLRRIFIQFEYVTQEGRSPKRALDEARVYEKVGKSILERL